MQTLLNLTENLSLHITNVLSHTREKIMDCPLELHLDLKEIQAIYQRLKSEGVDYTAAGYRAKETWVRKTLQTAIAPLYKELEKKEII